MSEHLSPDTQIDIQSLQVNFLIHYKVLLILSPLVVIVTALTIEPCPIVLSLMYSVNFGGLQKTTCVYMFALP